jgi:hypothetical protein
VIALTLLSSLAHARTIQVPSDEAGTLAAAVALSDVDVIELTADYVPGDVFVDGVVIERALTIRSDVDGTLRPTDPLMIRGSDAQVMLVDLAFEGSKRTFGGASAPYQTALMLKDGSQVTGRNLSFDDYVSSGQDIPVLQLDAELTLEGASFKNMTVTEGNMEVWPWLGWAIVVDHDQGGGQTLILRDVVFDSPDAGAVWVGDARYGLSSNVFMERVTVLGSQRTDYAPLTFLNGQVELVDVVVDGTGSTNAAGAIDVVGGSLVVRGGEFTDTQGLYGGAIHAQGRASVRLEEVGIQGAQANYGGGVMLSSASDLTATDSRWMDTSANGGGAVWADLNSDLDLTRVQICGGATSSGAAVVSNGLIQWRNVVVAGLDADAAIESSDVIDLTNATLVGLGGAAIQGSPSKLTMVNTALTDWDTVLATTPASVDVRYNLWWANGETGWQTDDTDVLEDPLWLPSFDPADCYTLPKPQVGSPTIDRGDPNVSDAWDDSRSDIGAFGGPDAWSGYGGPGDADVDLGTETPGVTLPNLAGGCYGQAGGAALLLLPLTLIRRRRQRDQNPGNAM